MKTEVLSKSILAGLVVAVVVLGGSYLLPLSQFGPEEPAVTSPDPSFGWKFPVAKFPSTGSGDQIAYSDIRDPGGIPQGLPVRLKIPIIGVDSAIEDALITPDGRMDVPSGSANVAWFSLGPHPGQVGSAVIGGHFGIRNGVPFVFYNLDKLKVGDKVYIVDDKGDTLAFQVRSISLFKRDADATTVFTSEDGLAHLNLITCEGIWNRVNDTYPDRRVVFTDAIAAEGPVSTGPAAGGATTKAEDIAAFPRTFGFGAQGVDVAALQTFLEQKGFLTMPPGVAKGFFGALTRAAVAKYQTSAGLSPVGVFGPLTRAKFLAELGGDTGLPTTGIDTSVKKSPPFPQALTKLVKSLYATPVDAIVTSILILSVVGMTFMLVRRKKFIS